MKTAFLN